VSASSAAGPIAIALTSSGSRTGSAASPSTRPCWPGSDDARRVRRHPSSALRRGLHPAARASLAQRLPHFQLGFTPSAGEELQSEYLVPRRDAVRDRGDPRARRPDRAAAARERGAHGRRRRPLAELVVGEARSDCLHLAPGPARFELLPAIEAALPETARPHWGKLAALEPAETRRRIRGGTTSLRSRGGWIRPADSGTRIWRGSACSAVPGLPSTGSGRTRLFRQSRNSRKCDLDGDEPEGEGARPVHSQA
jgi:hypothetical protein